MITSLIRTTSPFSSCRAEWCRRTLMTSAYTETSPMPPKISKKAHTRRGKKPSTQDGSPRIFVRPWDGVPSMLDGFAMLRGIESKYGRIKAFKFVRDGEVPSTYFSYFWVELEDPSRYGDATATVLQIPIPEVERKRPGGIGIADLQPFLRPTPQAKEEAQEWVGLTERMVDEVDESKRKNQVYDLRLEASEPHATRFHNSLSPQNFYAISRAFVKWGGFASQATTGPSATPTLDNLVERGSLFVRTDNPIAATTKGEGPPPRAGAPHTPFNYDFDEPVQPTETQTSASSKERPPAQPQSLLAMQREGKSLSKKQKALLQAAAISRAPPPNFGEKALKEGKGQAKREVNETETAEDKEQFQKRVWNLVRSKWF